MPGKPELLAPAGSWESFVAAVENGADAVYLGGKLYSARQQAGNFSGEDMARAVEYAHVRGVRVYVAVNTLLDQSELTEAARFLHFLQKTGVDAAIVQDLGLARLASRVIPELPLHASTQMTVHNLPSVSTLKEAGFERVILARELPLSAISDIAGRGGVAVEVFVHGALCICYSGQCLMSSMIGGRSGNRGRCAQPCRLNYTLVDGRGQTLADPARSGEHILSPRDLNMSENLPDLIRAGIASLKIEGRMKRPEYVATVIRIYRELIDRAASGGDFYVKPEEARNLMQIFNRDFTTGYFYGRPGPELMSFKRPNNRGVLLGRVKKIDRAGRLALIALEESLRIGDGIEAWVTEGGRSGTEVRRILADGSRELERAPSGVEVWLAIPGKVRPGDRVFKTHDADLVEHARATFTSPRGVRKIPVHFTVRAAYGKKLAIEVRDPDGFTAQSETASVGQTAENRPLACEFLQGRLGRLGNTPYELAGIACVIEGQVMVPVSEINEARRAALARLTEMRLKAARRSGPAPDEIFENRLKGDGAGNTPPGGDGYRDARKGRKPGEGGKDVPGGRRGSPQLAVSVADLPSVRAAALAGADVVYLGTEQFRSKEPMNPGDIQASAEYCARRGVQLALSAPRIQHDGELEDFCRLLETAKNWPLAGVQAGNLGLVRRAREITGLPVVADFSLNVFNGETASFLLEEGVRRVTLSPELTLEQLKRLAPSLEIAAEVFVHGALELMVSEYCAAGGLLGDRPGRCPAPCRGLICGLRDRLNVIFPVEVDRSCRTHIFNSRDLCMLGEIPSLAALGLHALRVEARREGPEYVTAVTGTYRTALDGLRERKPGLVPACADLARFSPAGFTRGHYFRGVVD
ncbi:MAG: DUF3656 domain-containing U32 family peptidase [Eubacteriales bacterium]